jgi:hypothetical protein
MPRTNDTVVYVHEYYPHYMMGDMSCDFTVTIDELRSLQNVDPKDCDQQDALEKCLEARAKSNVYFSSDLLCEREEMLKIIKRLVSKKRTSLMTEEGMYGFSIKSARDAESAARRAEALAEADTW